MVYWGLSRQKQTNKLISLTMMSSELWHRMLGRLEGWELERKRTEASAV